MGEVVVVTGAAGFIGSHVACGLVSRGVRVVGVDNFDAFYGRERKEENVRSWSDGGELVEADICDPVAMERVLGAHRGCGVIHLAARAGVRPSIEDPVGYARVNVVGTSVVLEASRRAGCGRMVIASSSSVYGNNEKVPFSEEDDVGFPISPYASTKRACELMGHVHWRLTGMPTACLRFFTVYGPRQRPDLAIARFMERIARGEAIEMFGEGGTSRDYTYIDDIVAGVLSAYERIGEYGYRIWNLGGSEPVRLSAMIEAVSAAVGIEARVLRKPMQAGDVERTWADTRRAEAELGYRPRVRFEEGVQRQWAWMKERMGR